MDIPKDWQTFCSELKLYTVRLPPGWTILGGISHGGSQSDRFGRLSLTYEGHTFFHDDSFYVFIGTFKFNTLVDRKTYTTRVWPTTYYGYPARTNSRGGSGWEFITADCCFHCTSRQLVPDPEQQRIVDMIFDSLKPTNPAQLVEPTGVTAYW